MVGVFCLSGRDLAGPATARAFFTAGAPLWLITVAEVIFGALTVPVLTIIEVPTKT